MRRGGGRAMIYETWSGSSFGTRPASPNISAECRFYDPAIHFASCRIVCFQVSQMCRVHDVPNRGWVPVSRLWSSRKTWAVGVYYGFSGSHDLNDVNLYWSKKSLSSLETGLEARIPCDLLFWNHVYQLRRYGLSHLAPSIMHYDLHIVVELPSGASWFPSYVISALIPATTLSFWWRWSALRVWNWLVCNTMWHYGCYGPMRNLKGTFATSTNERFPNILQRS